MKNNNINQDINHIMNDDEWIETKFCACKKCYKVYSANCGTTTLSKHYIAHELNTNNIENSDDDDDDIKVKPITSEEKSKVY